METARFTNYGELTGHGRTKLRADALAIAAAGLRAVDPADELARSLRLEGDRLIVRGTPIYGLGEPRVEAKTSAHGVAAIEAETVVDLGGRRLFLLGAGKATPGMAGVLDELLGHRFADAAIVVKQGQAKRYALRHIEVLEAAHPLPDESSLAGGLRLLAVAGAARAGDLVIALVTGGSSALAVVPDEGISLADKIETNRLLLASGAGIVDINSVRKHLSAIKGGRLGLACGCEILNFTVSDVVGDPLDSITDPTVPDSSTWASAQGVCDRYALWDALPPAVAARLRRADPAQETPRALPAVRTWFMADAARMCLASMAEARDRGYATELLGLDWQGEARAAGAALARRLAGAAPQSCLVAGGEHTVTLGTGAARRGGPSQEAALAAALELTGGPAATMLEPAGGAPAAVLCLDSDGSDGPTDAAGGLVDDVSAATMASSGCDVGAALTSHESYEALARAGDLVFMGPTDTNVNDLKIGLRGVGG